MRRIAWFCAALIAAYSGAMAQQSGTYFGELVLKPLQDGAMEIGAPFGFVDQTGRRWEVPPGSKTDGASIPRALWSIAGSPFTGNYLRAAVIHDRFCESKYRSWKATHDVFHEAMIASGVDKKQALLMWAAVYRFGPRWTEAQSVCWNTCAGGNVFLENVEIRPTFLPNVFDDIKLRIETGDVSKESMRDFIDKELLNKQLTGEAPARMRGFISDQFADDADGRRQFVADEPAPGNWHDFGTSNIAQYAYKVVRVRKPDMLRMRSGPGPAYAETGSIPAEATGIRFVGACQTMWCRVRFGSQEGWVNTSFLAVDLKTARWK